MCRRTDLRDQPMNVISPEELVRILSEHPGLDKQQIVQHLYASREARMSTTDVNRVLYANPRLFRWEAASGTYRRQWYLREPAALRSSSAMPDRSLADCLHLYEWQKRAAITREHDFRGVVEAVTGAGKTRLAVSCRRRPPTAPAGASSQSSQPASL